MEANEYNINTIHVYTKTVFEEFKTAFNEKLTAYPELEKK
jgi:hypothetical protein